MDNLSKRIKNAKQKSIIYYGLFGIACLIFLEEYITVTHTTAIFIDTVCPIMLSLAIIVPSWIWAGEQNKRGVE